MSTQTYTEVAPRLTETDEAELATVMAKTELERGWYADYEAFDDADGLARAIESQRIVVVTEDQNMLPIYRMRTMPDKYPPYLLPASALAVGAIGRLWRERLAAHNLDFPDLRLPITSMARTVLMQRALIQAGALATPDSTHCVGAAFDIDASSYYRIADDGLPVSVPNPRRDTQKTRVISDFLIERSQDANSAPMRVSSPGQFDSRVIGALLIVTAELQSKDYINRIVEFPGSSNQCLHIAPNPDVSADEWATMVA